MDGGRESRQGGTGGAPEKPASSNRFRAHQKEKKKHLFYLALTPTS